MVTIHPAGTGSVQMQSQHVPQKQVSSEVISRTFGFSMIRAYFVVCYLTYF